MWKTAATATTVAMVELAFSKDKLMQGLHSSSKDQGTKIHHTVPSPGSMKGHMGALSVNWELEVYLLYTVRGGAPAWPH